MTDHRSVDVVRGYFRAGTVQRSTRADDGLREAEPGRALNGKFEREQEGREMTQTPSGVLRDRPILQTLKNVLVGRGLASSILREVPQPRLGSPLQLASSVVEVLADVALAANFELHLPRHGLAAGSATVRSNAVFAPSCKPELVQFGLQQRFVGKLGLVLGDKRRTSCAAERVFDHLVILASAQQHPDGRVLVRLSDISIQRLDVEGELAQVLGLEAADFQFDGHKAVQTAVEEQQIEGEIPAAYLNRNSDPTKQKSRPNSMRKSRSRCRRPACKSASEWPAGSPRNSSM